MKRFSPFLILLGLLLSLSSCGKKGPLLPPLAKIPKTVEVFSLVQRGDKGILEWENPRSYVDGSPLSEIHEVEVWLYEGDKESVEEKEFEERARLVASIKKEEFSEYQTKKDDPSSLFRYGYPFPSRDFGSKNLIFGLRVKDRKKRKSEFSGLLALKPLVVSLPPEGIRANVSQDRIEIHWDSPQKNIDQSAPASLKGYNVYRAEGEALPQRLNFELIKGTAYEDRDFLFGHSYRYFLRASVSETSPFVESANSRVVEVEARDTFPPSAPSGLVSVAAETMISLTWDTNKERDLAGYRVWRKAEGEKEFALLTLQPVQENAYNDTRVEKNKRYDYAITAQDKSGNESPKSEIVSETIKDKG